VDVVVVVVVVMVVVVVVVVMVAVIGGSGVGDVVGVGVGVLTTKATLLHTPQPTNQHPVSQTKPDHWIPQPPHASPRADRPT
jgi:hypothetical protein